MPDNSHQTQTAGLFALVVDSYRVFDRAGRRKIIILLLLATAMAFMEAFGAALVVPFVALLNDPGYLTSQNTLRAVYALSPFHTPEEFIMGAAIGLFLFFTCKNFITLSVLKTQYDFIYAKMPSFSCALFQDIMNRPLSRHNDANSSELIRNVTNEVQLYFTNFLIPTLTLVTEALVLGSILFVLFWIASLPTIFAIVFLGGITKIFFKLIRKRVNRHGREAQIDNAERIKWVNQGFHTFMEAKVTGVENFFIRRFCSHEQRYADASRYAMLLNQTPRLFIETLAFSALFLGVTLALALGQNRTEVLPVLAFFAVASIRLLPSLNRIMLSLGRMAYYKPSAQVVLNNCRFLNFALPTEDCCSRSRRFLGWKRIRFHNIGYQYPDADQPILNNVNITIDRGVSIALIGPSGCGKTTLANILLGLLTPTTGWIEVDGRNIGEQSRDWQAEFGYIPQTVYLLDGTIRQNVAFGVSDADIDNERVWGALRMASLEAFVLGLPKQLDNDVGENGCRLSGGQKQRLGIARALYRDPAVLVMDEATSALDEKTEREIADTLEKIAGEKTVVIISHRPASIHFCSKLYSVQEGQYVPSVGNEADAVTVNNG